ncbi:MAG TPA: hypothetical protein VGD08_06980 [Stellaceae bacterium]|jgi:hypothetical protein
MRGRRRTLISAFALLACGLAGAAQWLAAPVIRTAAAEATTVAAAPASDIPDCTKGWTPATSPGAPVASVPAWNPTVLPPAGIAIAADGAEISPASEGQVCLSVPASATVQGIWCGAIDVAAGPPYPRHGCAVGEGGCWGGLTFKAVQRDAPADAGAAEAEQRICASVRNDDVATARQANLWVLFKRAAGAH